MSELCIECGNPMQSNIENYRYGKLVPVVLLNVAVHRCSNCGEHDVEIPRLEELHSAIAQAVARSPERLSPREVRWLRSHLGYSSIDFARVIGVTPETVSRWERLDSPKRMNLSAEKLLRLMALQNKPIEDYGLPATIGESLDTPQSIRIDQVGEHWAAAEA